MIMKNPRIKIIASLVLSYFIILLLPGFIKGEPILPTASMVRSYFSAAGNNLVAGFKKVKVSLTLNSPQPVHFDRTPTTTPSIIISSTISFVTLPPRPSMTISIIPSSVQSTITPSVIPSPFPTSIYPSVTGFIPSPTFIIPSPTFIPSPTQKQTLIPTPTIKQINYSKIIAMVNNPPQIGCYNNTTSGCPVDEFYQTPVDKGLGWSTYYGDEQATGYNVVADVIHNNKGISIDQAKQFISDHFMERQSDMSPEEAKATGKVIGFGATRTPKDLWRIKYLFGIDNPADPAPYFVGRVMIIDCATKNDWVNVLSKYSYSYKGWKNLNWITDLSKNSFIQIPSGLSNNKYNTGEGRPGVVVIDESILDNMIY